MSTGLRPLQLCVHVSMCGGTQRTRDSLLSPCFGNPITNVRNSPSAACTEQLRQLITNCIVKQPAFHSAPMIELKPDNRCGCIHDGLGLAKSKFSAQASALGLQPLGGRQSVIFYGHIGDFDVTSEKEYDYTIKCVSKGRITVQGRTDTLEGKRYTYDVCPSGELYQNETDLGTTERA